MIRNRHIKYVARYTDDKLIVYSSLVLKHDRYAWIKIISITKYT